MTVKVCRIGIDIVQSVSITKVGFDTRQLGVVLIEMLFMMVYLLV